MADESLDQLVFEMRQNNALTTKLLDEKQKDDTPQQLFAGNLFEILAQYDIFQRTKDELNDIEEAGKGTGKSVALSLRTDRAKFGSLFGVQTVLQELFLITVKYGNLAVRYQRAMFLKAVRDKQEREQAAAAFNDVFKFAIESVKRVDAIGKEASIKLLKDTVKPITKLQQRIQDNIEATKVEQKDNTEKVATAVVEKVQDTDTGTAAGEEEAKDERTRLQKIGDMITSPIKTLGEGLSFIGEKLTVKNAALATVMTALIAGLIAFIPLVAQGAAGLLNAFAKLFGTRSFDDLLNASLSTLRK